MKHCYLYFFYTQSYAYNSMIHLCVIHLLLLSSLMCLPTFSVAAPESGDWRIISEPSVFVFQFWGL